MAGASQQDRLTLEMEGMRITVEGLDETLKRLSAVGDATDDMRDLMHDVGNIIAQGAQALVPVRSGALQRSIRAGRGKTKAVIRAGNRYPASHSSAANHAGVIHYGYPARNIAATMYMVRSLNAHEDTAYDRLTQGLADLLKKNGLI